MRGLLFPWQVSKAATAVSFCSPIHITALHQSSWEGGRTSGNSPTDPTSFVWRPNPHSTQRQDSYDCWHHKYRSQKSKWNPFSNQQLSPSLRVLPLVVPSSMSRKICQYRGSSSARAEHAHRRGQSLKDCAVLDAVDPGTCIYVDITERRTLRNG